MTTEILTQTDRTTLVEIATYIADHPNNFFYDEIRPIPKYSSFAALKTAISKGTVIHTDCSGSTTMIFEAAGLKDPNGFGFNGSGNTTSLYNYLPKIISFTTPEAIDFTKAHQGTLLMFDAPPESLAHVCIITKPNGVNPELFSFGHNPPQITDFNSERLAHSGQTVSLLAIDVLGTTPADPHHYLWFDDTKIKLANDVNTERAVVENYDKYRAISATDKHLPQIKSNLTYLANRIEANMKATKDLKGAKFHRAWRLNQINQRKAGAKVV